MTEDFKEILFQNLKPLTKAIGQTFGTDCEVVLHDLSNPNNSIVSIENGHITGRKKGGPIIGGPTADLGLEFFLNGDPNISSVIGYETRTSNGKTLKSTSIFFRDGQGVPIAALCLNYDITELMKIKTAIEVFCTISNTKTGIEDHSENKIDNSMDVESNLTQIIHNSIEATNIPVHQMDKEQKLNIVRTMNRRGVFLVRGGVERAAQALAVSRFTIYNYLDEIRSSDY